MQLIGYPDAGQAFYWPESSVYHLITSGLRVGLAQIGDITGTLGTGTGSGLGLGHGSAKLYKVEGVYCKGPRKG